MSTHGNLLALALGIGGGALVWHLTRDDSARAGLVALLDELRSRPDAPSALLWLAEGMRGEP